MLKNLKKKINSEKLSIDPFPYMFIRTVPDPFQKRSEILADLSCSPQGLNAKSEPPGDSRCVPPTRTHT